MERGWVPPSPPHLQIVSDVPNTYDLPLSVLLFLFDGVDPLPHLMMMMMFGPAGTARQESTSTSPTIKELCRYGALFIL